VEKEEKFKNARRKVTKDIRKAKSNFYAKKFNEYKGNMKKTWGIINEVRGKSKPSIKPLFVIDNKRITDRCIIACEFNEYFVLLAEKMNELSNTSTPDTNIPKFTEYMGRSQISSIFLSDCTSDEIRKIISDLDNGKASDIPIKLIKRSARDGGKTVLRNRLAQ